MEGWRQWLTRPEKKLVQRKNKRTHLTPTGLLMEGDYTQNPCPASMSVIAIYQQLTQFSFRVADQASGERI